MGEKRRFVVAHHEFEVSHEDVERKLKGVQPEEVRQVFVEVNGKKYPVKQALAEVSGLIRSSFTTQHAVRVLRNLDFVVAEYR